MFLRRCVRRKSGKKHTDWALVESYRTAGGSRQRVVAYLGELKRSEQSGWAPLGRKGDRQFVPFKEEREVMARIVQLHDGGFTWKEVSVIIETWSPTLTFKATRLFFSYTLYDHFPKGYWAWWRCRLAYYVYKKILEREKAVLVKPNHADTSASLA